MQSCECRHARAHAKVHTPESVAPQEPVEVVDASAARCAGGRHRFAMARCGRALALTSDTRSVPLLLHGSGPELGLGPESGLGSRVQPAGGDWRWATAGTHGGAVQAVDWHPTLNLVLSAAADRSVHITNLAAAAGQIM